MKRDSYKVTVKVGDATVEVQGAESGVVKIVEALSDILRGARRATTPAVSGVPTPAAAIAGHARGGPVDIRTFFSEKRPSSDVEAAAAAAYFHQYVAPPDQRKETIDAELLQEAFRLAKWPLPKRTVYTLVNARNAGYLDSLGEGGQYKLNPVGYNLVEHTLGSAEVSEKVKKAQKTDRAKRKTRPKSRR